MIDLEICIDSVESAIAAARGGAPRVELCSALREGGITPSGGLIRAVRRAVVIDLFVMIRPRGGDFLYTDHEFDVMCDDIRAAKALGANGVAVGMLTAEGEIEMRRTRALVDLARPMQVTFHRAFDFCLDLDRALEDVIACGADRVLSSGGARDAAHGMDRLRKLCERAGDRIRIMAGAGIRESNVRKLVRSTGVRDVHTSLGTRVASAARYGRSRVRIGTQAEEDERFLVREADVRGMLSELASAVSTESAGR